MYGKNGDCAMLGIRDFGLKPGIIIYSIYSPWAEAQGNSDSGLKPRAIQIQG